MDRDVSRKASSSFEVSDCVKVLHMFLADKRFFIAPS